MERTDRGGNIPQLGHGVHLPYAVVLTPFLERLVLFPAQIDLHSICVPSFEDIILVSQFFQLLLRNHIVGFNIVIRLFFVALR